MLKDPISFPDFIKLDLRVGTIIEVEKVENSEKLLKMQVDFGSEIGKRQILAGLSKYYFPEDLLQKQVVAIINLEPRKIMGMESQGMLLAGGEESVGLLIPDKKLENGTEIH